MRLTVEPARTEDLDLVLDLLEDASRWLLAKGVEQWHAGQWKREKIAAAMERGWSDELFWPADAADAGYAHRLAIASDAHGRGLGRALLEWAGREIARRGRSQCDRPMGRYCASLYERALQ